VSIGRGTYAARSSLLGGTALHAASRAAIDQAGRMAAQLLDCRIRLLVRADVEEGKLVAHARSIALRILAAGESTSGRNAVSRPIAGRNAQIR